MSFMGGFHGNRSFLTLELKGVMKLCGVIDPYPDIDY